MNIELRKISFQYPTGNSGIALSGLDINIGPGEYVGIIGRTGAGKSTLLKLMTGLLSHEEGEILIDGDRITKQNDWSRVRHKLALALQFPEKQLFEETVFDDVAFGLKKHITAKSEIEQRVNDSLANMGIDPDKYSRRSPFNLSSGEKRRVALAGITVSNPEMILLDEPTIGVDISGIQEIEKLLRKYNESGCTICFVSHNMDFVARNADRIILLHNGKKEYDGSREGLFGNEVLLGKFGVEKPEIVTICEELSRRNDREITGIYSINDLIVYLKNMDN